MTVACVVVRWSFYWGGKMRLAILNWEKFNARKDVKNPSWFRLSHSLFEDHEFYDFTHAELLSWLYILCLASQKSSSQVFVNFAHLERVGRIKKKDFEGAIKKLEQLNIVLVDVTSTLRERDVDDTHTCATRQTIHNKTIHNTTTADLASPTSTDVSATPIDCSDLSSKGNELLQNAGADLQRAWLETYQDQAWIKQEVNKASAWILANPRKAPKKFGAFMNNWLSRAWESYRKTLPSNKPQGEEPEWRKKAREESRNAS